MSGIRKPGSRKIFSFIGLFMLMNVLINPCQTYSQSVTQKVTRQSAIEAFGRDDFKSALDQFSELSLLYPRDPLYKYYCGVCMVKLESDPAKASSLLSDAIKGSAAIRTVPSDGFFYLGRAQQMAGRFEEAIQSYNSYSVLVDRRTLKTMNLDGFIQQCRDGKGRIAFSEANKNEEVKPFKEDKSVPVTARAVNRPDPASEKPLNNQVSDNIRLPGSYEGLMSQAVDLQYKSDSLNRIISSYKSRVDVAQSSEKQVLKVKIDELAAESVKYRKMAGDMMAEAQKLNPETEAARKENAGKEPEETPPVRAPGNVTETKPVPEIEVIRDTVIPPPQKNVEIFSMFEVLASPGAYPDEKIQINPDLPSGLIYRIQVAVFRNAVATSYFRGLSPVLGFRNQATGLTTYYAGLFRRSADAGKALAKVKAAGFRDAFVGAVMDGKVVSADRAEMLEKEWGSIPLRVVRQDPLDPVADTVPPVLVFRIEASKSAKPVSSENLEKFRRLSGNRGLDIIVNESKETVCLIGKFISYQSASEFADLLVRNGLKEARVVAYLGKREIPVDVARQLFEKF